MKRLLTLSFAVVACLLLFVPCAFASDSTPGSEPTITHRMMTLVLQLGVILIAAKLGSILAARFKQPGVLGELLAGAIIGPFALGGITIPGFATGLFGYHGAFPVTPELYGICTVAAIILLFMVGLETDIGLLMKYSVAGSMVGIGGVTLSFLLGNGAAVIALRMLGHVDAGPMSPYALFFGVILTATSVGITARILSELRKTDSPEGVTLISGAIIDDVLGIVMLAVVMGIITASRETGTVDWAHIGMISLKAILVWLVATAIGLLASHRIGKMLKWFHNPSAIALIAFGMALLLAGLFERAGLALIVGAYVMGLSLSRTDVNHVIRENLEPMSALLVPAFFAVMGMLVDVRSFASAPVIIMTICFTLVGMVGKVVGCGVPALLCGFNMRGAMRIGVGMLPRGEVTLIIAGIALTSGAIDQQGFAVAVMMTFLTTVVVPPVLTRLFQRGGSGMRNEDTRKRGESVVMDFPSPEVAQLLQRKLLDIFNDDGFYVHTLNRREQVFQIRKDDTVISLHRDGTQFIFNCSAKDVPFVHTAVYEVLADLDRIAKALREPIDRTSLAKGVQKAVRGAGTGLSLTGHLTAANLVPAIKGTTKEEVIDELLEVIRKAGKLTDVDQARKSVWEREESMSTGMQYGVAIPHGKTDAVSSMACAVGIKQEGIDWDSLDGQPSRIFVMVISPSTSSGPHVRFLSVVSQVLNESGREALLKCKTSGEMLKVLSAGK